MQEPAAGRIERPSLRPPGSAQEFDRRLDTWGTDHRVVVSSMGLALVLVFLREHTWLAWVVVSYLAIALAGSVTTRKRPQLATHTGFSLALLALDVSAVAGLAYAWGTTASPIAWMHVPVVLGWTLAPRPGMGRLALIAVLAVNGALLLAEQLGVLPTAPAASSVPSISGETRALFFTAFTLALGGAHTLVAFVVTRWREYAELTSKLEAERQLRERERELAEQMEETARLESLGRLAGGVAHDFNNLLTGLLGFTEVAHERMQSDPQGRPRSARKAA